MSIKLKNPVAFSLKLVCLLAITSMLASCGGSKPVNTDYLYFQYGPNLVTAQQKETIIRPNDLLSIQVYSKTLNQEQVRIFNMPEAVAGGSSAGAATAGAASTGVTSGGGAQGYQVSVAGNINMPVFGTIQVAGLSKNQLQSLLVEKLTSSNYVKNPAVIVKFLQFNVNVLGEVKSPGTKTFSTDKVTILDALSAASDLTDAGRRQDVTVIREEENKKVFYAVDLRSRSVFESPVYFLQPNDIVYVKANDFKLKALNVDPDVQRKTTLFTTALGIVISLTTLIITVLR